MSFKWCAAGPDHLGVSDWHLAGGGLGSAPGSGNSAAQPGAGSAAAGRVSKKSQRHRAKRYKFKSVRFNRMHARLTYEGYPFSVTDFHLVLDACVYRNVEGSWRTIFYRFVTSGVCCGSVQPAARRMVVSVMLLLPSSCARVGQGTVN